MTLRYCTQPGCPHKVPRGRCPAHARQQEDVYDRFQRGPTSYASARWMRLRDRFKAAHPFCVNAQADPLCTLVTEVVDHIVPHRGHEALFWDEQNLQPMCAGCHGRKTAREGR